MAVQSKKHEGTMRGDNPSLRVEPDNVVLTAVKKSEDDDSLVLRFYEWAGREADVKLQLPAGAQSASETDLMETSITSLAVHHDAATVHTKPYEIKTVKVRFAPHAPKGAP